jgi:hypothetical protein
MRKYKVCATMLAALFVAASVRAQTISNQAGGPPLFTVTHDATLKGDGTSASPLGIAASPTVSGAKAAAHSRSITRSIPKTNISLTRSSNRRT